MPLMEHGHVLLSQASVSRRCSALHCNSTLGYSAALANDWLTAGSHRRGCWSSNDPWEATMELNKKHIFAIQLTNSVDVPN